MYTANRPLEHGIRPIMALRSLHVLVGFSGVLVFLGTGLYMATHFPDSYVANEAIRYMYRANHVYLLFGCLINLAVGIYCTDLRPGWRGRFGLAGSVLMLAAPFVLAFAFFFEAPRGMPERPVTTLGALMLLIGVLAQWPNRALKGGRN